MVVVLILGDGTGVRYTNNGVEKHQNWYESD